MKNKKVGIIGCGKIFARHLEAIEANEQYELVAICDTNDELLSQRMNKLSVNSFTDYKEMVSQTEVDFVVIATPNSLHYEQAIYCIENGCDVLIEKPATLDPNQIDKKWDSSKIIKTTSNSLKKFFLSSALDALNTFLNSGNTLSTSLSILATCSCEKLVSLILRACCCCFATATSWGLVPLNLKALANLSNPLSIRELL